MSAFDSENYAEDMIRYQEHLATLDTAAVIQAGLADPDEDRAWQPVQVLHLRGGQEVFDAAQALCRSGDARERRMGADILGQLGRAREKPAEFHDESVAILLDMLTHEDDPQVLNSIGVALGHRGDPRSIAPLAALAQHPDAGVRFGVAYGLGSQEDATAIATLITLMSDSDDDVRNWATFGLGSLIEADTPEIRAALFARLDDADLDVRDEALKGLAQRRDPRVVEPLLRALEHGAAEALPLEAATEMADPRLLPALLQLQAAWKDGRDWRYDELEAAIAACQAHQDEDAP